ncbi:MAG: hypothetical protein Q7T16_01550 [Candidatus Burarchaeum sp.]|nr:hypothetical protein [Candidatus Burarchaeum sp.]MDO8339321.1 hypothetical protein [Candidatus Burarchaeum sp.]
MSIELLIISFFAIAILISLFAVYANMQNVWAGGSGARHAQTIADRLAGAIVAVGQGLPGSEARVSLTDAEGLELAVQGRNVLVAWGSSEAKSIVSSPILTDDVAFELDGAKNAVVRKEADGKITVKGA